MLIIIMVDIIDSIIAEPCRDYNKLADYTSDSIFYAVFFSHMKPLKMKMEFARRL